MATSLYLIAIGGSGARCVESVVHLASTGLMSDDEINILFVDPDKTNGNYIRTCQQIERYNKCRNLVWNANRKEPCQWMRTPINNLGISTVGAANNSIADFFGYNAIADNDPVVTDLFNVLYSLPSQEIAVRGKAPHRYFLVLYVYFFSGKGVYQARAKYKVV